MSHRLCVLSVSAFVAFAGAMLAAQSLGNSRATIADGTPPVGKDGKPLNLDFETGTLKDWTASGDAFEGQPIKGDAVAKRRGDMKSDHAGEFWIGGFEKKGDKAQGTLTSATFKVTQPWATFLVGGGPHPETCVELVRADSNEVFLRASGEEAENMRQVAVDLSPHVGKEMFIRLVDRHTGHWGHLNFDDFEFHPTKPEIAKRAARSAAEVYANAGLAPEEAAKAMTVPDGFKVTLFAGEPDVMQPIAMALDDRGRLWIAEAYSYPVRRPEGQGQDRILIFEDTDGDGHFDKRTIFTEGLNLVSGLEVGFGGVWVGAAPYLMFIPIDESGDKPAGPPQILLDGWHYEDTHETLNAFIWGPDGWLYGCHGVFTHSRVGKPGTPDAERTPINAGIWRYHPTKHRFEVFAEGTSNSWGVDFNDYGQCFCTACVIPHLFHIIQGGRFERQAGQHFNPYTYDDIKTIADHRHYIGNQWNDRDRAGSDNSGGGHAHAGAMIYLGDAWPAKYRGQIFMNNIHGARINMDYLRPSGSVGAASLPSPPGRGAGGEGGGATNAAGNHGEKLAAIGNANTPHPNPLPEGEGTRVGTGYVGSHGSDFILANDSWSQILNLRYGPDGNAYMIDWYDKNQCHHGNVDSHDRTNGRIFKISYEEVSRESGVGSREGGAEKKSREASQRPFKPRPVGDLKKLSDNELAGMQLFTNDWYVRHARRILQERAAGIGKHIDDPKYPKAKLSDTLAKTAFEHADETRRLRGLWALHVTGNLTEDLLHRALANDSAYVRAWAVQLAMEDRQPSDATRARFAELAKSDSSPLVRLYLASAVQRLPVDERRWDILAPLVKRTEDAADHNLPLMYWYAFEPMATVDANRAIHVASHAKEPLLGFMARRIAAIGTPEALAELVDRAGPGDEPAVARSILRGMNESLKGRRQVPMPPGWDATAKKLAASDDAEIRSLVTQLGVKFGDTGSLAAMRKLVADSKADVAARREAVAALVGAKDATLAPVLQKLVADPAVRTDAIKGLAAYDDPKTPAVLVAAYPTLSPEEKRDAIGTLGSRVSYGKALLAAVGQNKIPAKDLSADLVRQLRNLKDAELAKQIEEVWGVVRDTPEEKSKLIAEWKAKLTRRPRPGDAPPDLMLGRAVFAKTCQQCHTLFGVGAKIGPDITGSNRADLDYILSNVLDPSALIPKEYAATLIALADGRILTGIVQKQDANSLSIATATETVTIPRGEIDELKPSDKSMMPDDVVKQHTETEVRALLAYLASPQQVPMLATADNAKSFFNGVDLAGWDGDPALWSVEKGEDGTPEIVGRTKGLDHNEFLKSHIAAENFYLTLEVKLVPNSANSGIQFRSEPLASGEMRGPQADIGAGWWGKLYEESGRGLLWDKSGEPHVKPDAWNTYEVIAVGSRVRTLINGHLCVDLDDPAIARRGIFGLQIHSGGMTEVRFRELQLELNPKETTP